MKDLKRRLIGGFLSGFILFAGSIGIYSTNFSLSDYINAAVDAQNVFFKFV